VHGQQPKTGGVSLRGSVTRMPRDHRDESKLNCNIPRYGDCRRIRVHRAGPAESSHGIPPPQAYTVLKLRCDGVAAIAWGFGRGGSSAAFLEVLLVTLSCLAADSLSC
jgi:hypothetical protein